MKILLLEDNYAFLGHFTEVMRDAGHEIIPCSTIYDANFYIENEEKIDYIVADLNMPPSGLSEEQAERSHFGLLTGWIWLVEHAIKKRTDTKFVIYSSFISSLKEHLQDKPDELKCLQDITLIDKNDVDVSLLLRNAIRSTAEIDKKKDRAYRTIFLSFCSRDTAIADIVEGKLKRYFDKRIGITRWERGVGYKDNFREFMDSLKDHDFVLSIISDQYLKSRACMYEVGKIIEEPSFQKKLLYIVLSDDDKQYYNPVPSETIAAKVYNLASHLDYFAYWKKEYESLHQRVEELGIFVVGSEHKSLIEETKEILDDIQKFLLYIFYARGIPFRELMETDFKVIKDEINDY